MSAGEGVLLGRDTEVADAREAITGASGRYVALVGVAGSGAASVELEARAEAAGNADLAHGCRGQRAFTDLATGIPAARSTAWERKGRA